MKEIEDIVQSFNKAQQAQIKTALATVVLVEGSSYRRPGARMLVTEDGQITGTISGGCLETDAIRKALLSITQQQNKLVAYNSMDDEDFTEGVQLGCNGIVYILFEPIDATQQNNPIVLLQKAIQHQKESVMVTLFNQANVSAKQQGTTLLFTTQEMIGSLENSQLQTVINEGVNTVLQRRRSSINKYPVADSESVNAFIELLKPQVELIICGAGNDALPLLEMAHIIGWHITIADGRKTYANSNRFEKAGKIIVGKPAEVVPQISIHEQSIFVLMSHNYQYDIEMLRLLIKSPCGYIGILGPKKKTEKMLAELAEDGIDITAADMQKIHGPAGLDIGAETPQEIALSIISEIKAVLSKKAGGALRNKSGFIHDHSSKEDKPTESFTG
jgi:xanthine/CO dehydrogenase XdhC/CoxF family maturation factor